VNMYPSLVEIRSVTSEIRRWKKERKKERKRKATFLYKLVNSQNELCELFSFVAQEDINIFSRAQLVIALLCASWQFLPRHIARIRCYVASLFYCVLFLFVLFCTTS